MSINELSHSEYQSTFRAPMRRLGLDEDYKPVAVGEYVAECIHSYHLPTSLETIDIEHVYLSADKKFTHIVFSYGQAEKRLIVIVSHDAQQVYGDFLLDLAHEYGRGSASGQ